MKVNIDDTVKCPYYNSDVRVSIRCDNGIGDYQVNYFSSKSAMTEHKEDFCKSCYMGCPLYKIISTILNNNSNKLQQNIID